MSIKPGHLFLGTFTDNSVDAARKGRAGLQKVSASDAMAIRRRARRAGVKTGALSKRYGISGSQVWKIVHGKFSWTHLKDGV